MVCLIALVIFAVLGIFSLNFRQLAREAFECVFNRLKFQPCQTKLDERIKAKVIAKALKHNNRAGKFVQKYFEAISWLFIILMLASFAYSVLGIYNLIRHGTCDPKHPESCILTPKQINQGCDCKDPECEK